MRLADRESGLPARTIARRLLSVSGLYACLVARGDTPVRANPVLRGLSTRRQGGSRASRMVMLVRVPRVLSPEEAGRLIATLGTAQDPAMVLAACASARVLGLRIANVRAAGQQLFIAARTGPRPG